ncbi:hypothetical protein ROZALSC1DRAFT_28753, partial [Rozella allomycis CSF55]
ALACLITGSILFSVYNYPSNDYYTKASSVLNIDTVNITVRESNNMYGLVKNMTDSELVHWQTGKQSNKVSELKFDTTFQESLQSSLNLSLSIVQNNTQSGLQLDALPLHLRVDSHSYGSYADPDCIFYNVSQPYGACYYDYYLTNVCVRIVSIPGKKWKLSTTDPLGQPVTRYSKSFQAEQIPFTKYGCYYDSGSYISPNYPGSAAKYSLKADSNITVEVRFDTDPIAAISFITFGSMWIYDYSSYNSYSST